MTSFGENLRKIRIERGMSQEEFAALLGTSKQVISRYETAQRSPKVSTVAEYAEKLGVSISALTGDVMEPLRDIFGPDSPTAKKLQHIRDHLAVPGLDALPQDAKDERELLDIFHSLNDNGRSSMLNYARFLNSNPDMKKDTASNDMKG